MVYIAEDQYIPEYSSIKRSLNSILINSENKDNIKRAIDDRVLCATRFVGLGSLYTFYTLYKTIENREFVFFKKNPLDVIKKCFNSFLPSAQVHNLEQEFQQFIVRYNVRWPNCRLLSNITKYLIDGYRVNFENNIKLHARKRIKLFFGICGVPATRDEIDDTLKFMFDEDSDSNPKNDLINAIPNIDILRREFRVDTTKRFFFREADTIPMVFNDFRLRGHSNGDLRLP